MMTATGLEGFPLTPANGLDCQQAEGLSAAMMRAGRFQSESLTESSLMKSSGSGSTAIPLPGLSRHASRVRMGLPGTSIDQEASISTL